MSLLSARSAAVTISSDGPPAGSVGSIVTAASLSAISSPAEDGLPRAILHEATHPGPGVFGGKQACEASALEVQTGCQIRLKPGIDGVLGGCQCDRWRTRVGSGHLARRCVHLIVGHYLVGNPDRQRLGGPHEAACEDKVLGLGGPDQARQALRAAGTGDQPEQDLRLA